MRNLKEAIAGTIRIIPETEGEAAQRRNEKLNRIIRRMDQIQTSGEYGLVAPRDVSAKMLSLEERWEALNAFPVRAHTIVILGPLHVRIPIRS